MMHINISLLLNIRQDFGGNNLSFLVNVNIYNFSLNFAPIKMSSFQLTSELA